MRRLPMRKITEALRMKASGLSTRKIAASLSVGQSTVGEYLKRAERAGLSWPLPEAMTEADLERRLFAPTGGERRRGLAEPDWAAVHRELRRKNVTLSLLWEEYRAAHPDDGYGYSRFCELYRRWEGRLSPVMRQHHVAGERVFVDYAGHTVEVVDAETGEVRQAQVFVGVSGGIELHLCRGDLDADPAGLDRVACPDAGILRRRARAGRQRQPQIRCHQGVLLRARPQPDLCRDGGALRHRRHSRPAAQTP